MNSIADIKWVFLGPGPGQELGDEMFFPDPITSAGTRGRGKEQELMCPWPQF